MRKKVFDNCIVFYDLHKNGNIANRFWVKRVKGVKYPLYHRLDGPAIENYFEDGIPKKLEWWVDAVKHRIDGPAEMSFYRSGNVFKCVWYCNGVIHRDGGPAELVYYDNGVTLASYSYYKNGLKHRDDGGPAEVGFYEDGKVSYMAWFIDGKAHRIGGPAIVNYSRSGEMVILKYMQNGELFREDGPAEITAGYDGYYYEWYMIPGVRHRPDGPCIEVRDFKGNLIKYGDDEFSVRKC